jgi:hypothetical protein
LLAALTWAALFVPNQLSGAITLPGADQIHSGCSMGFVLAVFGLLALLDVDAIARNVDRFSITRLFRGRPLNSDELIRQRGRVLVSGTLVLLAALVLFQFCIFESFWPLK